MNFVFVALIAAVYTLLHVFSILYRESMMKLFRGDNLLPRYMLLSSYAEGEQITYTTLLIVGLVSLFGIALQKLIREDKYTKQMTVIEEMNSYTFSKEVFCSWDNSLVDAAEAHDLSGLMTQQFREKLAESKRIGLKKTRTNYQVFELYCLRALGFTLHASMQFAAYTTIVYLTVQSQSISKQLVSAGLPGTFSNIIVPGTVTAINSGTPMLLKYITRMEKWDSGQVELNILLFRMYLSNMLNLLILAFSYALLADPMLFAEKDNYELRQRVEREFDDDGYTCRLNQTADGMFTLVLTEFVLNPIIFFGAGYGNVVLSWVTKKWVKVEFDIAQRMVAMLYFVALMFLCFPFAPLTVIVMPLMLAARLKLEKKFSLMLYARPRTIWVAHKSGITFTIFYMLSLLFIALPSAAYFLTRKTFPKDCDIQDEFIGLCASALNTTTNTCTLDTSSDFYDLFSDTSYCRDGYPACICEFACGPYVSEINSYESFKQYVYSIVAVKYFYEYLIQYSCGAWLLFTLCYILARMRRNTIKVANEAFSDKERGLLSHIEILENEKKKNEKLIQRLKLIDTAAIGGS